MPAPIDPFAARVSIPVRVHKRELRQLDGRPLPQFKNGSVAELIVPVYAILDDEALAELQEEATVDLLPADAEVVLGVKDERLNSPMRDKLLTPPNKVPVIAPYHFAKIELLQPLRLKIHGHKTPKLAACSCKIPALKDAEAKSLNHAFTLLSNVFETDRISHTGNVFERAYTPDADGRWVSLDTIRLKAQVRHALERRKPEHPNDGG